MTIKDLKQTIADLPDDMRVLIPLHPAKPFDGILFSPCIESSGPLKMAGDNLTMEEVERLENLNQPIPEVTELILVPCGYFEMQEDKASELN